MKWIRMFILCSTALINSCCEEIDACFQVSHSIAYVDDAITFTDCSEGNSFLKDCDPNEWFWNFGDGTTGTGSSVTHKYETAGNYTVTLTVGHGKKSMMV